MAGLGKGVPGGLADVSMSPTVRDAPRRSLSREMFETEEDFGPFPGGYDYLVDFLPLSFPKESPSWEHTYEEVLQPFSNQTVSNTAQLEVLPDALWVEQT
ncbi:unnamed protein product [Gulo gulo]|uniref:Uncharacterized protein n=1 Tax=Gulo gulo TaxID=48420 RepID=A0A9X9LJF9_GULGU|nr:unnamed protein product [Gulo gulo]